jgi:hypothetical protein
MVFERLKNAILPPIAVRYRRICWDGSLQTRAPNTANLRFVDNNSLQKFLADVTLAHP